MLWLDFLRRKVTDPKPFEARRKRIEAWVEQHMRTSHARIDLALLNRETEKAVAAFDSAVSTLRQARGVNDSNAT